MADLMTTHMRKTASLPIDDVAGMLANLGFRTMCGVDEAGRGPLAGPVVAAAVIVPHGFALDGLTDSKLMTPAQRDEVFARIAEAGFPCAVGIIDHETIDRVNILKASLLAMRRAVMELPAPPECVIVDGNHTIPNLAFPQYALVHGDRLCPAVSAASVIAKVTRDRIMDRMERLYPQFRFSQHKGYCTPAHLEELRAHGPCEIHRKSFGPVAELLQYALV
ncbi:MAG TPA: ribonuclease HII [candidate division Zixibacteria bacterium]|nr:ribonuclease HII [candidate division Zixibacteria bacterium]HPM36651.1 ribonuclease HII [candidate division Zixibacteria bacterium]